jgi:hypothetical protein
VAEFKHGFRDALPLSSKLTHPDFDGRSGKWTSAPHEPLDLSRIVPKPPRAQQEAEFKKQFRAAVKRGGLLP